MNCYLLLTENWNQLVSPVKIGVEERADLELDHQRNVARQNYLPVRQGESLHLRQLAGQPAEPAAEHVLQEKLALRRLKHSSKHKIQLYPKLALACRWQRVTERDHPEQSKQQ